MQQGQGRSDMASRLGYTDARAAPATSSPAGTIPLPLPQQQQQQQQHQQTHQRKRVAFRKRRSGATVAIDPQGYGAAAMPAGREVILRPGDPGFTSVQLPHRHQVPYLAVLWNEFLGTLMYAVAARLFVAFFGGTTFAATIPTLFGTALSNSLAFMAAMAVFGGVSGGHFNPAITLCVLLVEVYTRVGFLGEFKWQGTGKDEGDEGGEEEALLSTEASSGKQRRPWKRVLGLVPYFVVQFVAFILAALLIWAFLPPSQNPRSAPVALGIPFVTGNVDNGRTFGTEIFGSFLFLVAYMLLLKMFGSDRSWFIQVIRSVAFGLWYFGLILVFAPWAGAVWNPTLWLAFAIITHRYTDWWILLFPAIIASIATSVFCVLHWWISRHTTFKELKSMGKIHSKRVVRGVRASSRRLR